MRSICLLILSLLLISCSTDYDRWYLKHPDALREALSACPQQSPKGLTCQQLQRLNLVIEQYSIRLRSSPQAFGQDIIVLQNNISALENTIKSSEGGQLTLLQKQLDTMNQDLQLYLLTVRLYESPEA